MNYLFISRHKIGYALVKFPLWTWGIYSSRTVRFNSSRLSDLLKELFLPFFEVVGVAPKFCWRYTFKRSDWTISVICYLFFTQLLQWHFLAEDELQSWASNSLAGGIPSDICSACRWCGVSTKPPFQTFVFNWQKKIRVCWRLIRRCCIDDAVVRLLLPTLPLNRTRVETAIDVDLTLFVPCKSYSKCKHSLKLPLSLALVAVSRTN